MNESIREAQPSKPVIVLQTGQRIQNTNLILLRVGGIVVAEVRFAPDGLKAAPEHKVRAYVELFGGIEVVLP